MLNNIIRECGTTSASTFDSKFDITTSINDYGKYASQHTVRVDIEEYRLLEENVIKLSNIAEHNKHLLEKEQIVCAAAERKLALFIEATLHLVEFEDIKQQLDKLVQIENFKIQTQHILGQEYNFLNKNISQIEK